MAFRFNSKTFFLKYARAPLIVFIHNVSKTFLIANKAFTCIYLLITDVSMFFERPIY